MAPTQSIAPPGRLNVEPDVAFCDERAVAELQAAAQQQAARRSLRRQIARLERDVSDLVAAGFPHIAPQGAGVPEGPVAFALALRGGPAAGPRLLGLSELERRRDALVARLRAVEVATRERQAHEHSAKDLLAEMRLQPARHKFVRLRVADLGERGCGVWEVRPRLGLIGMLAGWWQLKLSSGCPLAGAARRVRAAALIADAV